MSGKSKTAYQKKSKLYQARKKYGVYLVVFICFLAFKFFIGPIVFWAANQAFDMGKAHLIPGTELALTTSAPRASISLSPAGDHLVFAEYKTVPEIPHDFLNLHPFFGIRLISSLNLATGEKTEHIVPDSLTSEMKTCSFLDMRSCSWFEGKYYPLEAIAGMFMVIEPDQEVILLEKVLPAVRDGSDCAENEYLKKFGSWFYEMGDGSYSKAKNNLKDSAPLSQLLLKRTVFDVRVSPERNYLAYVIGISPGGLFGTRHNGVIRLMDLETQKTKDVCMCRDWGNLVWSNDSRRLYFAADFRTKTMEKNLRGVFYIDMAEVFGEAQGKPGA